MNVRQLTYFLAVAQRQSLTRAAEDLWIATSPLSRSIKDLERDLGVQLLERTARGVQLTAAGRALVPKATQIVRLVENLPGELARATSASLVIGLSPAITDDVLAPLTSAFDIALADITVVWQPDLAGALADSLLDDTLDAAVFPISDDRADAVAGTLDAVVVGPGSPMGVLMRPDDVLASAPKLSFTHFRGRRFAIPARSDAASTAHVRDVLRRCGVASVELVAEHLSVIPGYVTRRGWYSIARIAPDDPWTTYYRSQGLVVRAVTEQVQTCPAFVWSRRRATEDATLARAVEVARGLEGRSL